jgi:hypothetical protein
MSPRRQERSMSQTPNEKDPDLQGEGNYTAARRHRESVEDFVESGKVDQAAKDAAPDSTEEAEELREAEKEGKSHAKR